jgi:serine/threonine protein kinase
LSLYGFKKLYGAKRPRDWIRWVLSSEPFKTLKELRAPVSDGFSELVSRMLAKDPKVRYQKVSQVQKDLDRHLEAIGYPTAGL